MNGQERIEIIKIGTYAKEFKHNPPGTITIIFQLSSKPDRKWKESFVRNHFVLSYSYKRPVNVVNDSIEAEHGNSEDKQQRLDFLKGIIEKANMECGRVLPLKFIGKDQQKFTSQTQTDSLKKHKDELEKLKY